jgi:hypothetical protein
MNVFVHRFRGLLLGVATAVFLACVLWAAHTPGEPRTVRDFLFVIQLLGVPFLVFAYALWSLMGWTEAATRQDCGNAKRARIALAGAVLAVASAALLLLILPFWNALLKDERLGELWVITGLLMTTAAILCGIIGTSQLRRPAIVSFFLLPFWIFAAGLLLKATMD